MAMNHFTLACRWSKCRDSSFFGLWTMRHIKPKVPCHFLDDLNRNASQLPRVSSNQRIFANRINQARNAPGMAVNFTDRFDRENAGHSEFAPAICNRRCT